MHINYTALKIQEEEKGLGVGEVIARREVAHDEGRRVEEERKGEQGKESHGKLPGVVRAKGEATVIKIIMPH